MRAQARKRINTRAFVRLFNYLPRFTPYMIIQVYIFVYSYTSISISRLWIKELSKDDVW